VLPSKPFYNGNLGAWKGATDGWRDDLFPRKHSVLVPTFAILSTMVRNGLGLGYLPKSLGKELGLNWYPMVSGNSPLMDTGHFFGLDRTSLVSKEEDLGASYIQFPSPLHMFAHMLQTGNTSAMFLYIMYLEVQLHSKIGKWVTKPMCKWEDSVP
jgi:hypothetical protein